MDLEVDYRYILRDRDNILLDQGYVFDTEEFVVGLAGQDVSDLLESISGTFAFINPYDFQYGMLSSVEFSALSVRRISFNKDNKYFELVLFEYLGEVVTGAFNRYNNWGDLEKEIKILGMNDNIEKWNEVVFYIIDEVRHLI